MPSHDTTPPTNWPPEITFLTRSRIDRAFPADEIRYLFKDLQPRAYRPPNSLASSLVRSKRIVHAAHPANGQFGLFAARRLEPRTRVEAYIGIIKSRSRWIDEAAVESDSDYELSLVKKVVDIDGRSRLVDISVDAQNAGNLARLTNDYRGIASRPNVEFRQVVAPGGMWVMEIWTLEREIKRGEELLLSYGKGYAQARQWI